MCFDCHRSRSGCSSGAWGCCCTSLCLAFGLACQEFASVWPGSSDFLWLGCLRCLADRPCHPLGQVHPSCRSSVVRRVSRNFRRNCFGRHHLLPVMDFDKHFGFHEYTCSGACYSSGTPPTDTAAMESCITYSSPHYSIYISASTVLHAYWLSLALAQTSHGFHHCTAVPAAQHSCSSWSTVCFRSMDHAALLCQCYCCSVLGVLLSYWHSCSVCLAFAFYRVKCKNACQPDSASSGFQNSCLVDSVVLHQY